MKMSVAAKDQHQMQIVTNITVLKKDTSTGKGYTARDMKEITVQVSGVCLKEDDSCSSETVEWVECGSCQLWVHVACADDENIDICFNR